jgi:hypothetical protein
MQKCREGLRNSSGENSGVYMSSDPVPDAHAMPRSRQEIFSPAILDQLALSAKIVTFMGHNVGVWSLTQTFERGAARIGILTEKFQIGRIDSQNSD